MKSTTNANSSIKPMEKPSCLGVLVGAAVLALAVQTSIAQTTIYQDTFGGNSSTDLNGTSLDVASGYAGGTLGAMWAASGNWNKDGVFAYDTGPNDGGTALLPFTPQSGYIYTLSANNIGVAANNSTWIGIGFTYGVGSDWTDPVSSTSDWLGAGAAPVLWGLCRDGTLSTSSFDASFIGTSTTGGANMTTHGVDSFTLTLDTTGTDWSVTWNFDGDTRTTTVTQAFGQGINYVGFSANATTATGFHHDGQAIDNFLLTATQVPEPSVFAMLGLGLLAVVVRRR
jgi:hypothetical protein